MNSTKQKIVLAAIKLFNEEGLTNVKNSDIAKAAKMSLSNVNYHFKTKQDLVYAVTDHMKEVLEEKVYGNWAWFYEARTRRYARFIRFVGSTNLGAESFLASSNEHSRTKRIFY